MPINTWRGTCRYCGKKVGARKGFAGKPPTTGSWLVWHGKCEPAGIGETPETATYKKVRTPYADD